MAGETPAGFKTGLNERPILFNYFRGAKPLPMDEELVAELEKTMGLENCENERRSTVRLIQYMLSIQTVPAVYRPVLERFAVHAFEKLPASGLPILFVEKFNIPVRRRRRVSFGSTKVHEISSKCRESAEAGLQRRREAAVLGLTNTDLFKKFRPKNCIEEGTPCTTVEVSLIDLSVRNACCTGASSGGNGMDVPRLKISLDDVVANPGILDAFR